MDIKNLSKAVEVKQGFELIESIRKKTVLELSELDRGLSDGIMKDINRALRSGIVELEDKIKNYYAEEVKSF